MDMQLLPQDTAIQAGPRAALLQQVIACLEREHVHYCLVGDTRRIPQQIDSDVDMVVDPTAVDHIPAMLAQFCQSRNFRLVQVIQHEPTAYFCVLAARDARDRVHFLQADICSDYYRNGKCFLAADELLSNRIKATDETGREKGFYVPPSAGEFIYYLLKKVDKQDLDARAGTHLSRQWRQDPAGARAKMARYWPPSTCTRIDEAARRDDWDHLRTRLPDLRRTLQGGLSTSPSDWLREGARKLRRIARPAGLLLALMGPDGSGKSSVGNRLLDDMAPAFWHTTYVHLRPNIGSNADDRDHAPVVDPHGKKERNWLTSIVKCLYYLYDYNAGYLLQLKPQMVKAGMIVFDRYYHDLLVDPKRYRYGGPRSIARLCGHLIPNPELFVFLDAPAELLQARKQEVSFRETKRQRQAYRTLAGKLSNSHVVDASQPLDEVVADVEAIILDYMAQRTAERLDVEAADDD